MIKRLKRRFLIVNMTILTSVLIGILVSVFVMMYSSEVRLSYELMESIMSQKRMTDGFDRRMEDRIRHEGDTPIIYENGDPMVNDLGQNGHEIDPNNFGKERGPRPDDPIGSPFGPNDTPPPFSENNDQRYIETEPTENNSEQNNSEQNNSEQNNSGQNKLEQKENGSAARTEQNEGSPENEAPVQDNDEKGTVHSDRSQQITKKITVTSVSMTEKITNVSGSEKMSAAESQNKKTEPDPFRGRVRRSYIYVEFSDVNDIDDIEYEYGIEEDDEAVKEAVKTIFEKDEERGTITIGENDYRYMFHFEPPKAKYNVILLDRTLEANTASRLMIIFLIIGGAGLVFVFFISLILANWTTKPVEKAWNQQKEFIANASHELKTPLTVISTNTDVVLSSPDEAVKTQTKWLNYIKNETVRMSKLVNSLLCIAKYDANKVEIISSKVGLSNLLSSIALQYEPLVYEKDKVLITDIDDNIQIMGDEDKLKQVINILLDNALKYSLDKGTIKISLKCPKPSSVCMTVSNTSIDIPKEQVEKLFDRFYRIDDSRNRKTGGTGLGLNIAKTIVEGHNGTINAVNKNKVTSFIVTFHNK